MNKTAIKKFAVWARTRLMEDVKQRAFEYGITESAVDAAERLLTEEEKDQRLQLIHEISRRGYRQVMEEAACFWFVRFAALRFMEVNGFLPSGVEAFQLQSLKEAMSAEWDIQAQDRRLRMFGKIPSWMALLLPDHLQKTDSVVGKMISDLQEDDFREVEIIGWLYQFYLSEKTRSGGRPSARKGDPKRRHPCGDPAVYNGLGGSVYSGQFSGAVLAGTASGKHPGKQADLSGHPQGRHGGTGQ